MTDLIKIYETTELKLAALILSTIPESTFKVQPAKGNSIKKIIQIFYLFPREEEVNQLIREYIERRAFVDVYKYNHVLSQLRDNLRDGRV